MAEFLVKRGRKVTIVEQSDRIGEGVLDFRVGLLLPWLEKRGVVMFTGVKVQIVDKGLTITTADGKTQTLEADSIVPTSPLAPNNKLLKALEGKAPEVYAVGDCKEPRMIVHAIRDGWTVAREI